MTPREVWVVVDALDTEAAKPRDREGLSDDERTCLDVIANGKVWPHSTDRLFPVRRALARRGLMLLSDGVFSVTPEGRAALAVPRPAPSEPARETVAKPLDRDGLCSSKTWDRVPGQLTRCRLDAGHGGRHDDGALSWVYKNPVPSEPARETVAYVVRKGTEKKKGLYLTGSGWVGPKWVDKALAKREPERALIEYSAKLHGGRVVRITRPVRGGGK